GLQLLFGLANPSDFGGGVDNPRHGVEIDVRLLTRQTLGHSHTFFFGFVSQHRTTHHVTHCPDTWQAGGAIVVHNHETTLVQFQTNGFCTQTSGVRHTANGDDQLVGFQLLLGACSVYVVDSDLFGRLLDLANFHAHIDLQTLLGESFQGFLGHVAIHGGQELGSAFQNGHFGTQTTPHATQFQTNHTGTDNSQFLGNLGQTQCAVVGQNLLFVELSTGQGTSRTTGSDDDVLGNQLFGVGTSHIHRPASVNLGAKRSGAVEEVNFVLLEQVQDTV